MTRQIPMKRGIIVHLILLVAFPALAVERGKFVDVHSRYDEKAIANYCDDYIQRLVDALGIGPERWFKFNVVVNGSTGGTRAGFCETQFGGRRNFVIRVTVNHAWPSCRDDTLRHELTHAVLFYVVGTQPLIVLNEGFATFQQRGGPDFRRLMYERARGSPPRLRTFIHCNYYPSAQVKGWPKRDDILVYVMGRSIAEFLIYHDGSYATFGRFYKEASLTGFEQAVKKYYHYPTLEDFEAAWIGWVRRGQNLQELRP